MPGYEVCVGKDEVVGYFVQVFKKDQEDPIVDEDRLTGLTPDKFDEIMTKYTSLDLRTQQISYAVRNNLSIN